MAWTQKQIDTLREILASGEASAAYEDRRVQYRNVEELQKVLASLEREVNGQAPRERFLKTEFSKGLD